MQFFKIENNYLWNSEKSICKKKDNIFSIIKVIIDLLERFIVVNYKIVNCIEDANIYIFNNRVVILCSENKIYTISFPFSIQNEEGGILFEGEILDIHTIKAMNEIIKLIESSNSYEEFFLKYDEIDNGYDFKAEELEFATKILKKLFEKELGYIRYDYDAQAEENQGVQFHPAYHLDIFYEKDVSIKLGLGTRDDTFIRDNINKIFQKLLNTAEAKLFLKDFNDK